MARDVTPRLVDDGSRHSALLVHVVDGAVEEFGEEFVGVSAKQPGVAAVEALLWTARRVLWWDQR